MNISGLALYCAESIPIFPSLIFSLDFCIPLTWSIHCITILFNVLLGWFSRSEYPIVQQMHREHAPLTNFRSIQWWVDPSQSAMMKTRMILAFGDILNRLWVVTISTPWSCTTLVFIQLPFWNLNYTCMYGTSFFQFVFTTIRYSTSVIWSISRSSLEKNPSTG